MRFVITPNGDFVAPEEVTAICSGVYQTYIEGEPQRAYVTVHCGPNRQHIEEVATDGEAREIAKEFAKHVETALMYATKPSFDQIRKIFREEVERAMPSIRGKFRGPR